MAEYDVPVARIVVDGCPAPNSRRSNFPAARLMLFRAFEDRRWPGKAMFAITPGGFVVAPYPTPWKGNCGWASRAADFQALVEHARDVVAEVLTPQVLGAARGRTAFLTLGIDLDDGGGKRDMEVSSQRLHAELVAIFDVEKGAVVRWTGKSYPVSWQEGTLVQEPTLTSHRFECGTERALILGCHDLNMFSERGQSQHGKWKLAADA